MLTFRLFQVFKQIIDSGSVTSASERLNLSQPTVSLQLKKLANEVGLPLVNNQQGKLVMTEAGEAVYQCAQEISASQHKLTTHIQALQGIEKGRLSIVVVTTAKYVIPPILSAFSQKHSGLDIEFKVRNRGQVIERLHQNKDDIYIFSHPPTSPSIVSIPFLQNNLLVIAPKDYQGPDNCNLSGLANQRFLVRENGSGTRKAIEIYCQNKDVSLNNTMLVESNEAIKLSVASGLGIAILSDHTLAQGEKESVKILNIEDFPLQSHWHAVTSADRPQNLACQAFLTFLSQLQSTIKTDLV